MKPIKLIRHIYRGILNIPYYNKLSKEEPIIIGGCGRSGTTLLLSILAAHPKVHGINIETGIFRKENLNKRKKLFSKLIISSELYFDRKPTAERFMEKTPNNVNNIDGIFNYFDNKVKFIHIIRDGRDIVTSKHPTNKSEFWVDFDRWVNDVENGLKYKNHRNLLTIKYEDLISNFDETITAVLTFLNLDRSTEVLNFEKYSSVRNNVAWDKPLQPLYIKKREQSEIMQSRIKEFIDYQPAKKLMKTLNYLSDED